MGGGRASRDTRATGTVARASLVNISSRGAPNPHGTVPAARIDGKTDLFRYCQRSSNGDGQHGQRLTIVSLDESASRREHLGDEAERNLQFCQLLVNFDLPWNPMVIEQRIGRIHR